MMMRFPLIALSAALVLIGGVGVTHRAEAHPHEFIDARLALIYDAERRLQEVEVEWRYDPFTSMLILADMELDPSAVTLPASDLPSLQGFDLEWVEGYNGDLWAEQGGTALEFGAPEAIETRLEEGQIVSRHRRAVSSEAVGGEGSLFLRIYDPEFYIAYTIPVAAELRQAGDCVSELHPADMERAYAALGALLDQLPDPEEAEISGDFPRVGREFSDEVRVVCES